VGADSVREKMEADLVEEGKGLAKEAGGTGVETRRVSVAGGPAMARAAAVRAEAAMEEVGMAAAARGAASRAASWAGNRGVAAAEDRLQEED
jgi:hypothetical protein